MDTVNRKTEPTVRLCFAFEVKFLLLLPREQQEELSFFESFGLGSETDLLDRLQLFLIAIAAAMDALLIKSEAVEDCSLFGEGGGDMKGVGDLKVITGDVAVFAGTNIDSEEIVFDSAGAGQTQ